MLQWAFRTRISEVVNYVVFNRQRGKIEDRILKTLAFAVMTDHFSHDIPQNMGQKEEDKKNMIITL